MEKEISRKAKEHEDAALKLSMQFFANELLPYLNIQGKVVGIAPTELVELEIHKLFQDFNLVMEDGNWKHFEFQSSNEGIGGLKRFRTYEALTSYKYGVEVTTYVLYSGKIRNPVTEFTEGINTYRIQPIIMGKENADELLIRLDEKIKREERISKADLVPIVLCPLMGGESSLKDRVKKSFEITQASKDLPKEDIEKIEAVIYTMAEKFLEEADIEEVREIIKMTKLGQMLVNDGREEGRLEGRLEGEKRKLANIIEKKLVKGISVFEIAEMLEETEDAIKALIAEYQLG